MSDITSEPENAGDREGSGPDVPDDDREAAALMRAVMRAQEMHREGGVDPELDERGADPGPG
jgi:hypothetical protein